MEFIGKMIMKYGARKFVLPLLAWAFIIYLTSTGQPVEKIFYVGAMVITLFFILMEGIRDIKSRAVPLIMAFSLILGPGTVFASIAGDKTPTQVEKTPSATSQGLEYCQIVAQNTENGENGDIPTPGSALDQCMEALEELRRDPPDIPMTGFLMSFGWYRDLKPWQRASIAGIVDAAILGLFTYLGTLTPE